jgi:hypothetical protein
MITMPTRKIIIWLSIILIGAPASIILLDDLSMLLDNIELLSTTLLILSLSHTGWRLKKRLKDQMQRGIGRDVRDDELTSITAWMRIPDQATEAAREAERYDFDD